MRAEAGRLRIQYSGRGTACRALCKSANHASGIGVMRLDPGQIEVMDEAMATVLREKTGAERLAIANRMWISAREMLTCNLRAKHPDWDDRQVKREVARRLSHGLV